MQSIIISHSYHRSHMKCLTHRQNYLALMSATQHRVREWHYGYNHIMILWYLTSFVGWWICDSKLNFRRLYPFGAPPPGFPHMESIVWWCWNWKLWKKLEKIHIYVWHRLLKKLMSVTVVCHLPNILCIILTYAD